MTKHGKYKTPTYSSWHAMRSRCNNPNRPNYSNYGGRGIKVCKRWDSFQSFYADMGEKPEGYYLDRIDNDKGYEPSNCRWLTPKESANNRRDPEEIILGNKFNDWTPLKKLTQRGCSGVLMYLCRCVCGNEGKVKKGALLDGRSTKCKQCFNSSHEKKANKLVGEKYGKWTILSILKERTSSGNIQLLCRCSCGKEKTLLKTSITTGKTKSCRSCAAYSRLVPLCSICLCYGHHNTNLDEAECDLLGFCERCDKFDINKFLLKGKDSDGIVSRSR